MMARCQLREACGQAGYALLMGIFMTATILILVAVAAPVLLTQGQREKEEELIWRGQQYARGIKLYYRKHGRFPQSLDDITKPKNNLRFLRQQYKDPMNREDGSWRLIYIGPNGQLIGSVKHRAPLHMPAAPAAPGTPQQPNAPAAAPPTNPPQEKDKDKDKDKEKDQANPEGPAPAGPVFGGSIIGVGSKVKRPSVRIYDGGTTYREWEFLWDPTKEAAATVGPPGTHLPTAVPPNRPHMPARPE